MPVHGKGAASSAQWKFDRSGFLSAQRRLHPLPWGEGQKEAVARRHLRIFARAGGEVAKGQRASSHSCLVLGGFAGGCCLQTGAHPSRFKNTRGADKLRPPSVHQSDNRLSGSPADALTRFARERSQVWRQ